MENPSLINQKQFSIFKNNNSKMKLYKSKSIKIFNNNRYNYNNDKNTSKKNKTITLDSHRTKTINSKKSNSTNKIKNKDFSKQKTSSSINSKRNMSNKLSKNNFDFSKFDTKNFEYDIDKNLCKSTNFHENNEESFLTRMQKDIKNRQTKDKNRKKLLEKFKPKATEEERVRCFNRLINDINKRNKIRENIENQNEFFSSGISPKKMSKRKWDYIYENRFCKYQEKIDNNLREKIIENEKINIQKEEEIIEQINSNTKKVNKKELEKIINRLYYDSKKKEINKKINNLIISDKDNANGMKKEENNELENNINTKNDNSEEIRGKKQHSTIKSTKLRKKKNSYFGSVIYKTLTFEQQKPNSLMSFIQSTGKNENKYEKRKEIQKEIKEIENESINIENMDKNKKKINLKSKKKDKLENIESISDIWANETRIKKSKSLKRILVNDFNNKNIKFNIN